MKEHDAFDEWDADRLLTLVGEYLYRRNPAVLDEDERFMNWLARDIRRRPPTVEDWPADRIRRVRQRVIERALAEHVRVLHGGRTPEMKVVPARPMAQLLDHASREGCAPWASLAVAAGAGRELWDEACDRWVELPATVPRGRYLALNVAGDSMTPLIHQGDTILVRLGTDVQPDTIIVARRDDDTYVVKRVGRMRRRSIQLLSLNARYEPIVVSRHERAIIGTVVMRWCDHEPHNMPMLR
jgi:SOS-response transcriptional repressor LexA